MNIDIRTDAARQKKVSNFFKRVFMRFFEELKQLHQYALKQMGLTPFF
jgi:hypothetical protein